MGYYVWVKGEHSRFLFGAIALLIVVSVYGLGAKSMQDTRAHLPPQFSSLDVSTTPSQAVTRLVETEPFNPIATPTATSSFPEMDMAWSPYIEVLDSCGPYYGGACVNMRSGPGTQYPIVARLRKGVVLKVADGIEQDGRQWYSVFVDEVILHPERVTSDWFVAADAVEMFYDDGDHVLAPGVKQLTQKRILVDISDKMLYAYDGDVLFMQEKISTGLDKTPTPIGSFAIFKKTPSRYMQGSVEGVSQDYYDLPGVPWNLYFTIDGAVIHGAYWHDHFGEPWSHGCVNLPPDQAKKIYRWATLGTVVTIQQ